MQQSTLSMFMSLRAANTSLKFLSSYCICEGAQTKVLRNCGLFVYMKVCSVSHVPVDFRRVP